MINSFNELKKINSSTALELCTKHKKSHFKSKYDKNLICFLINQFNILK